MKGIIDEAQNPSFATAIGLLMYGAKEVPIKKLPFGLSLPNIHLPSFKIFKKLIDIIKSFIP